MLPLQLIHGKGLQSQHGNLYFKKKINIINLLIFFKIKKMETIQFEVRTGRTKTSIYEDIATVYGYTPTIEEIQDKTQENTYLETKEV